jgi:hypothetical protein
MPAVAPHPAHRRNAAILNDGGNTAGGSGNQASPHMTDRNIAQGGMQSPDSRRQPAAGVVKKIDRVDF